MIKILIRKIKNFLEGEPIFTLFPNTDYNKYVKEAEKLLEELKNIGR